MIDLILKIAGIISALTIILSVPISIFKIYKKIDNYIKDTKEYRKNTDKKINENTMYTLKLVIMNADLSLEERIAAGDKYIELGGNGYVKHIYQELLEKVKISK